MKGTIVKCLEDLVVESYGRGKWEAALEGAGLPKSTMFLPLGDVEDAKAMEIVGEVCKSVGITPAQAADAFGDYWVNTYSQKMYGAFYSRAANAREFLTMLDSIHVGMTKTMPQATPPRFNYEWKDKDTLIMEYRSPRDLIDFAVALVKGVGRFYKEDLQVSKLGFNRISVTF